MTDPQQQMVELFGADPVDRDEDIIEVRTKLMVFTLHEERGVLPH